MPSKLKPTPPAFEPKGKTAKKSKKAREDQAPASPTREPEAPTTPPAAPQPVRVTAGPYFDDRHPRPHEGWVVITRAGDVVQHHRFRSREDAQAFVGKFPQ